MSERKSIHGQWSSAGAFFLAATGAAVGLGNVWRFPYLAATHGGGAFIIVYALCVTLVAMPLLVAEIVLGRRARQSPVNTLRDVALDEGRSRLWMGIGFLGMTAGIIVTAFYGVVAGWSLEYLWRSLTGLQAGLSTAGASRAFLELLADPWRQMFWYSLFLAVALIIVARGVRAGLERAVRFMVPCIFAFLLVLIVYALWVGRARAALGLLFIPDFSRLNAYAVVLALSYSFYSLSIGVGTMVSYGAYLPNHLSIWRMVAWVVLADSVVAILAGLAIYPLVLAKGLGIAQGPLLIFAAMPAAFGSLPYGALYGGLFFALLVLAAWTSAISLLEPAVSWLVELGWRRGRATVAVGALVWVLAMACDFSFNLWSALTWRDMTLYDLFNALSSDIMLPLGGFLLAFFTAWMVSERTLRQELRSRPWRVRLWLLILRYVTPVGVLFVLFNALGLMRGVL